MRPQIKSLGLVVAASLVLAACGSSSSGGSSGSLVSTASNSSLNSSVLVDAQGLTLYHLSGEQHGKFICTSTSCLQAWHPLTVSTGTTPGGSVGSLGTVKRPDGKMQVTYKGMPLYTFTADRHQGDAKGQGIKDLGTWSAVTTGAASSGASAPATPAPSSSSTGGGYSSGY